ncbi:fimbrial biogenesis outer membrane usher protein [Proteus alimentorum]|uniref:Fimbrial biogenesis outer membrane usher protein n=1 Tax=Proteus alimentorum TaxID=1973495 RepID=A0ABS0IPZ4_9GAMM|nr:fimbria/pilus outer membrane usher protein [Proteus alimentorum]MBG2876467.1 fimbrial biogenesis outer membrane usher protein [Proteus alimentorum]MBG2878080.1 fimbrial biogenesis outer membrane usher protein [Proteus alimentorum]
MKKAIFVPSPIFIVIFLSSAIVLADESEDYDFDPSFIRNYATGNAVNLNVFTHGDDTPPGLYSLDVDINEQAIGNLLIKLEKSDDKLQICLSDKIVNSVEFTDKIKQSYVEQQKLSNDERCIYLSELIPESFFDFNFNQQHLSISIPQRDLLKIILPENNPINWDEGKSVLYSNYYFNRYTTRTNGEERTTNSLNLNSGFNFFKWRFRHDSQLYDNKYTSVMTYLERDIDVIKGKVTVGDFYSGSIFSNGSSLRGLRFRNDNSMLSSRESGFAPVIHGIAKSQAQVKVYVSNSKTEIYNTVVPAGPFEINDLLPIYYSGDLIVEIIESNGEKQTMIIPVQSGLSFTRPGKLDFDIGVGKLRYKDSIFGKPILDAAFRYGINNYLSASYGSVVSQNYLSNAVGMTLNTNLGAFNTEMIHAKAKLKNEDRTLDGTSYKLSYSKAFSQTDTYINLSSIQYDTKNYIPIYSAMQINSGDYKYDPENERNSYKLKTQYTLSLSQRLPYELGSLSLSGSLANYWNANDTSKQYTVSYTTNIKSVGVISSLQKINNRYTDDTLFSLSVSIPLFSEDYNAYLTSNYLSANKMNNFSTGLNGMLGQNIDYSVSVGQDRYDGDKSNHGSASLGYQTSFVSLATDYSHYQDSNTLNLSASGAVVAHSDGVLLSNTLGNTFAVIKVDGIKGANVLGSDNKTNNSGYAIQPNLVPYRKNFVGIETENLGQKYTLEESKNMVIPRSGSAVFVNLKTQIGAPVILKAQDKNNHYLPLGATVYGNKDEALTFVGQGGKIFLNLNEELKNISIHTNLGDENICVISLEDIIKENINNDKIKTLKVTCDE